MKIFDQIEKVAAYALLALMAVIILLATLEVAYVIATNLFAPPGFFIGVRDLFELFGLLLMVLIALELMASIRMYLKDHSIHAELMLLVAITAITRKIVILALTAGYYLVRRTRGEKRFRNKQRLHQVFITEIAGPPVGRSDQ